MSDLRTRTRWIVLLTLVGILAYDVWVYITAGGRASVSSVFGWACSWKYAGWWIIGSLGFVSGHLPGMMRHDAELYWWRVAVYVAAWSLGFWLTWRMP